MPSSSNSGGVISESLILDVMAVKSLLLTISDNIYVMIFSKTTSKLRQPCFPVSDRDLLMAVIVIVSVIAMKCTPEMDNYGQSCDALF
ncbi:hypothetical protein MAR_029612 [Mya arenaria]|uniref:Uncharacterized protein n=1 Tax=Mya arenaria TaxID=6604 RepID=A0ABY7DGZ1_MYAAR|nr:hypothetical protein MAR_029612 [Mya arenaria]